MTQNFALIVSPHDSVIARDGRPFGNGLRMRSLDWIYPSVLAGAFRTLIGEQSGGFAIDPTAYGKLTARLKSIAIAGPLPCIHPDTDKMELCLPSPLDVVVQRRSDNTLVASGVRPFDLAGKPAGCDFLPELGLSPTMLPPGGGHDVKPERVPAFWSLARIEAWLLNAVGDSPLRDEARDWPDGYFDSPVRDRRVHVAIDETSATSKDGMLFTTVGLDLMRLNSAGSASATTPASAIAARIHTEDPDFQKKLVALSEWSPIGGERRLARWSGRPLQPTSSIWSASAPVRAALGNEPPYVRMVLATPALFKSGWLPKWLHAEGGCLVGEVPSTNTTVRLIGACVDRWTPVSGWDYEHPGPKPVRRLVPAGSVYFFEVVRGTATALADRWLTPISDDEQDCRDGFGLAVWGIWRPFSRQHTFSVSAS